MDVSVLTAYKSELRRVATILKDKDHVVKKRKRAEPEEEQPQKFYLVATFRWVRHWRVLARQHSVINVPRFRPGYHKVVIFFWDEQEQGTEGPWWRIVLRLPSEKGWFMLNMDGGTDWHRCGGRHRRRRGAPAG
eukprot:g20574.t1